VNLADVTKILAKTFLAGWKSTKVALENEVFDKEPSWVRLSVRELASPQQTLGPKGARRFKRDCVAIVQVFWPVEGAFLGVEGGVDAGLRLAEDARRFFEGESIAPAKFHNASIGPPQKDPAAPGRWWTRNVSCPFFYVETA
jgi:hypothetical protein